MQTVDEPRKIPIPFADDGIKRDIPNDSQIGIVDGAASFTDGFPQKTFLPLLAGGVPPAGADFNGVLNLITQIQRWQSAGGLFTYDSSFAATVGGYPKGARLANASRTDVWVNAVENNTSNPDAGGAGWLGLGDTLSSTLRGDNGKKYRVFGYVIRNTGAGWNFIDDVDHHPINMDSVGVVAGDLRVTYGAAGSKVVTHTVVTDETMAAFGLSCGPSVGLEFSNIKMYMPFACWIEKTNGVWAFGASDGINPWFGPGTDSAVTTSPDGSEFTINHKVASGSHPPVITVLSQSGGVGNYPGTDVRVSYGGTSVIGRSHAQFEGYVAWVGPGANDWSVDTPNIAKPTFNFTTGVLTVTHENLGPDTRAVSVDAVGGVHLVATGSTVTGTTFQVVFQDYAGVNITAANANMKFRYMRPRNVKTKAPDGMRVAIQRGPVILNPTNVTSGDGNLWGFGILEE